MTYTKYDFCCLVFNHNTYTNMQSCMNGDMDDMTPFYKGKVSEINAINVQNPMLFWQLVVDLISHDVDVFIRATARVDEYQRTIIELEYVSFPLLTHPPYFLFSPPPSFLLKFSSLLPPSSLPVTNQVLHCSITGSNPWDPSNPT